MLRCSQCFFFFNDTATTEIYTLSLHDALPICGGELGHAADLATAHGVDPASAVQQKQPETAESQQPERQTQWQRVSRSEEHTSELQSRQYLVCRLLLEKKK